MILHVSGELSQKTDSYVVIEAAGIGYQIFVPSTLIDELPNPPEQLKLLTYHHIREESQTLYGFLKAEQRDFFVLLTSVSGVGPKVGLNILSTLSAQQMVTAILSEDLAILTSISGVGKKMAERLILELKDKVPSHLSATELSSTVNNAIPVNTAQDDVFQAMKTLGYSSDEVKRAYRSALMDIKEDMPLDECIKILLKNMV